VEEPTPSSINRPKRGALAARKAVAEPKKKTASGKGKEVRRAAATKKRETYRKTFMDKVKNEREVHFEHELGGEFVLRLSTWLHNDKPYISIRRANTFAATFPAAFFNHLRDGLDAMTKRHGELFFQDN